MAESGESSKDVVYGSSTRIGNGNGVEEDDGVKEIELAVKALDLDQLSVAGNEEDVQACSKMNGFKAVGHVGYFKSGRDAPPLVPEALEYSSSTDLDQNGVGRKITMPDGCFEEYNGQNLSVLFADKPAHLIKQDYRDPHAIKQQCCYRFLLDSKYFEKIKEGKLVKPDFITNEGRITKLLKTPLDPDDAWKFYAVRFNDIIFLSNVDYGDRGCTNVWSYCGQFYERLVAGDHPEETHFDEYDENHQAVEVTFSSATEGEDKYNNPFRFLMITEGVQNSKDNQVKVRAYNPGTVKWKLVAKFRHFWAVTASTGCEEMILGHRDYNHFLRQTRRRTPDQLWMELRQPKHGREICHEFTDRCLNWMKAKFAENNPSRVKEFFYSGKSVEGKNDCFVVSCKDLDIDAEENALVKEVLVPLWFVDGVQKQQQ